MDELQNRKHFLAKKIHFAHRRGNLGTDLETQRHSCYTDQFCKYVLSFIGPISNVCKIDTERIAEQILSLSSVLRQHQFYRRVIARIAMIANLDLD